ncbi:hypothetical protein N9D66_02250, partial [Candidatus Nanopelagicales bacterium]|nr:hypothetical protein [Candidatus Nanopelagicales bacterium]
MATTDHDYDRARSELHLIAELILAGSQHRESDTVRLTASNGQISTTKEPAISLDVAGLHFRGETVALQGSVADLAQAASVQAIRPDVVYHDAVPGDAATLLTATPEAIAEVLRVYTIGAEAMAAFSQEVAVLWPEHFDLAIRVDEVNYGISPGDGYSPKPHSTCVPYSP